MEIIDNAGIANAQHHVVPTVVEVIRRMKEGYTEPFLCKCDDGLLYVVKAKPSMPPNNLTAEYFSACLAEHVGLPLPAFSTVNVPREITEYNPELRRNLHSGLAFATRYIDNAVSLSFTKSRDVNLIPIMDQKKIYLFDRWIMNGDRTLTSFGGNVNMLYDVKNNRYYLIDHNLAFDQTAVEEDFDTHVYSHLSREWEIDMVDRLSYKEQFVDALAQVQDISNQIPEDWLDDEEFLVSIDTTLQRAVHDDFWSNIS